MNGIMRKIVYVTCILLLPLNLIAQNLYEIVKYEDLSFYSYFEELAFYKFSEGDDNMLRLFVAIDPDVDEKIYEGFQKDLSGELNRIKTRRFHRVKKEKKVRMLYDYVNIQVLTRYKEKILFPHLFVNGTFNCLTASAFYGFLLDSLGIEYHFRESYNHVHPVAFIGDEQIKIETTDRLSGLQYYDDNLKNKFVNYLLENDIITKDQYYSKSTEELFNEYFFPRSSINLKELAGLHYMNDALYKFDAENYRAALEQIKKAWFIYPSDRMLTIFQFILANTMSVADYDDLEDAELFVYLSRMPPEHINPEEIGSGFAIITDRLLFNSSHKDFYDDLYDFLDENMEDGEIKDIISFQYYFYRGRSFVAQYMFRDGLEYFIRAYEYNPYNLELQSLLISTIAATFENTPGEQLVQRLENYSREMPVLAENGMFISLQMMAYLVVIEQYFDFDMPDEGMESMLKFEELYEANAGVEIDYELLGDAYSSAAVYYFKQYNKQKAIKFLERGLEIAPENYELRYRLRSIE